MEKKCSGCFPLPHKGLQELFSSSSGNNQWWAIPGRKQKHFDWHVVLEGTEGVHGNDDEHIDAEYISWTFFPTCPGLPVTAKALWVHPPSSCTLRPQSRAWCVRASRSCLSDLCSWSKLADAELLLLYHRMMSPGHLTPPSLGLIMVGWS